jgi:hypothetical protein
MLLVAMPQPAHAYVDPGSGAMLWQIVQILTTTMTAY